MFTRKDYLDGNCTHREYYAQFVNDRTRDDMRQFRAKFLSSEDEHLNDIPLEWWDRTPLYPAVDPRDLGDFITMAGKVCILKEAARQIIEEES